MVLFGGEGPAGYVGDTWTWNGTTWTQAHPATSPSARYGASMAYDAATGNVVLFGGEDNTCNALNDTWSWNGTTWTKVSSSGPSGRLFASMDYDTATGNLVLFGGENATGSANSETWTWNGTTWSERSPAASPTARNGASMAYDTATGNMVLFGGQDNNGDILGDTWTWSGTTWTQMVPAPGFFSPSQREGASMAYDPGTGNMVLFGGVGTSNTIFNDTWIWNGTTWLQARPDTSPSIRFGASMNYDQATGNMVLFGGANSGSGTTDLNDTWTGAPDTAPGAPSGATATAGPSAAIVAWTAPASDGGSPVAGYDIYEGTSTGGESSTPVNTSGPVTGTDYTVHGLNAGTTYYFTVEAVNVAGNSTASNETLTTPFGAPGPPTGLVATGLGAATAGNGQVALSWTAPASDGGSPLTGYDVYEGTSTGGESSTPVNTSGPVNGTNYTVTGLTAGTAYYFTVEAVNPAGNGPASNEASAVSALDKPPTITSANAVTFDEGTAGTFTVTATGYPASTFSEMGPLPTGVTLSAKTGVLSGTPTQPGSFPITITATNGVSPNATQSFTLTVVQPAVSGVLSWGYGADGELGNGTTTSAQTIPVNPSLPPGVLATAIAGGGGAGYAIGSDNILYAWGYGSDGELGNGTTPVAQTTPVAVPLPGGATPKAIAAGQFTGYAIGSDGVLYAWGYGSDGELGNGTTPAAQTTPVAVPLPGGATPKLIAAGASTAYAIGSDGVLYAWGLGADGELGNGTTPVAQTTPVAVPLPGGATPKAIAAGAFTGYAIGSDGVLYAWGYGSDGELGNNTTDDPQTTPVAVSLPALVTPKAIAAGLSTGYTIGSDGVLYAWGYGSDGELGNNTTDAPQTTPVAVSLPGGATPKTIAAGGFTGTRSARTASSTPGAPVYTASLGTTQRTIPRRRRWLFPSRPVWRRLRSAPSRCRAPAMWSLAYRRLPPSPRRTAPPSRKVWLDRSRSPPAATRHRPSASRDRSRTG